MTKILAVQMESMDTVHFEKSASFALMSELQNRGYAVYHYEPDHMLYEDGEVYAFVRPLQVQFVHNNPYTWLGERQKINLKNTDVILLRSEPPFDMSYITATYYLDFVKTHTRIINDPTAVRNFSEKLIMGFFPQFSAPTLVSSKLSDFEEFIHTHNTLILKPLYGYGGRGIVKISKSDGNLQSLLEILTDLYNEPIMAQKYLPEISQGDKRIFLANGQVIFAFNRVPMGDDVRANLDAGGRIEKIDLTQHEQHICNTLKPFLQQQGLGLAGIDMIGEYLTEINVTSPGGISQYRTAFGIDNAPAVCEALGL